MKRWARKMTIIATFCCLILTTSCNLLPENNAIEEIAPVIFWYVKKGDKKQLKISTAVPPVLKEKKQLFSLEVDLLKQGSKDFNLIYYREMKVGQLRMIFIDEEIAKSGVLQLVNSLLIDPDTSQRLFIVIVKGDFESYVKKQIKEKENTEYYLYRMLKHYEDQNQGELTPVNLHDFKKMLYTPLSDPYIPVFKADQNNFKYEGTAIFKKDKLVKVFTNMDDQVFQLIGTDNYLKYLVIPKLSVVLGRVQTTVHYTLNADLSKLFVNVKMMGRIEDFKSHNNGLNDEEIQKLKYSIEDHMEKNTKKMFKTLQQEHSDPFQIGTKTLTPFGKSLTDKEWYEKWRKMYVTVNYELQMGPLQKDPK